MAIKISGIDNPTQIKFVNNGTTTNITEVYYKAGPNSTPVKVWPSIAPGTMRISQDSSWDNCTGNVEIYFENNGNDNWLLFVNSLTDETTSYDTVYDLTREHTIYIVDYSYISERYQSVVKITDAYAQPATYKTGAPKIMLTLLKWVPEEQKWYYEAYRTVVADTDDHTIPYLNPIPNCRFELIIRRELWPFLENRLPIVHAKNYEDGRKGTYKGIYLYRE